MSFLNRVVEMHKRLRRRQKKSAFMTFESLFLLEEAERIVSSSTCFYCDVVFTKPDGKSNPTGKTADHIIPRSQNGRNHPANYVAACGCCNQKRDVQDFIEFSIGMKLAKEYRVS